MKYSVDRNDRYCILAVQEDNLNSVIAPDLKSELIVLSNQGVPNLIIDLSDVKFVDSSGLSCILTGNRLWNKAGGVFVLTGVNHPSIKKLIEISRLDSVLAIIPTVPESIDFIMMTELQRELESSGEETPEE